MARCYGPARWFAVPGRFGAPSQPVPPLNQPNWSMKLLIRRLPFLMILVPLLATAAVGATGSISVTKSTPVSDLPRLAKISMITAINAALTVAPGTVIEAKLRVESGSLQFSVIIVGADQSLCDVDVDAGNGKVLLFEKNGEEIDLEPAAASVPAKSR